jgi:hypothetical protein
MHIRPGPVHKHKEEVGNFNGGRYCYVALDVGLVFEKVDGGHEDGKEVLDGFCQKEEAVIGVEGGSTF